MGTDDPGTAGLAEKKPKSHKPACRVFVFPCPIRVTNAPVFWSFCVDQDLQEEVGGGAALVAGTTFREFRSISLGKWRGFFGNESGGISKNPLGLW
jgi:hypothetical protein